MKFTLTIETDNDAVYRLPEGNATTGDVDSYAVADLITKVAEEVKDGHGVGRVVDPINGQVIGRYTLADD